MPSPPKALVALNRAVKSGDQALIGPEIRRTLEAVHTLLHKGFPAKDRVFEDPTIAPLLYSLCDFCLRQAEGDGPNSAAADLAEALTQLLDRYTLARNLREGRKRASFTIRELAKYAGVDHTYISRIERCAVPKPSGEVLNKLARTVGSPLSQPDTDGSPEEAIELPVGAPAIARRQVRKLLEVVDSLSDDYLELLIKQALALRDFAKHHPPERSRD